MNRLLTIVDSKYQRLEYLESTGTQFLKIPIELNLNDTVITDVAILDAGSGYGDTCFFESGSSATRKGLWGYRGATYYNLYYSYGGGSTGTGYNILNQILNQRVKLKTILENSQYKIYVNDTDVLSVEEKPNVVSTNLGVFAQYSGNYKSKCKLFGLQAIDYQTGVTKLNLVPVLRKTDNELGMLDLVEGKFYTNAGTGKFTANLDTMYAIIQGSPTVQDGRVSGFSASNYLQIQNLKNVDINEIVLKINIPSSSLNQSRYMSALYGCISITTYSGTSSFTYSVINTSGLGDLSIGTLQPDTNYWIKYINDGTNCSAWLSEDGISFTKKSEKSSDLITETSASNYIGGSENRYFGGSIDLNRSYIKINSTKYNLQAVVGYTVVGSPTITDGVVSGFSASDYLEINNSVSNGNIELYTRFKFNTSESGQKPIFGFIDKWHLPFCYIIANRIAGYVGDTYANLQDNTWYRIKVTYNGTVAKCEVYNDDETLRASNIREYSTTIQNGIVRIGGTYGNLSVVIDIIDLNETYIKINNKLWFNGQQA